MNAALGRADVTPGAEFERARDALAAIELHAAWPLRAAWIGRALGAPDSQRGSVLLQPTRQLSLDAGNLSNAWHALRNDFGEAHWQETLDLARLGLGEDLDTVALRTDPAGGRVALALRLRGVSGTIPAASLSDGQLTWLTWVALFRLPGAGNLLGLDQPEQHLHPALLARVADLLVDRAERCPVLVATHADTILDALPDPASSVVVCKLDSARSTRLSRPDAASLDEWLTDYRGFGALRAAGYEAAVLRESEE